MLISKHTLKCMSRGVGIIFHPLLGMLFVTLILMYGNSSLALFSSEVKRAFVMIITLTTVMIPLTIFPVMKFLGIISAYTLEKKIDRSIPLLFVAICYILIHLLIIEDIRIHLFSSVFISSSVLLSILAIISYFWKVSIHLAVLGAITAILYVQTVVGIGNFDLWLLIAIMCAGVVGSARLYLRLHNVSQICGGFVIGYFLMALLLTI